MIVDLSAKSDVGRVRRGNEDNFLLLDLSTEQHWSGTDGPEMPEGLRRFEVGEKGLVLVVSDGMGGALAGDVASRMAIDAVREMLVGSTEGADGCKAEASLVDCLRNATVYANLAINHRSLEDPRCSGMGATFTGAAVKNDVLDLVQVGDSRAYVVRGSQILQVTKDQSLVQQLVDVGQITEQDKETHMFRNVILQALGAQTDLVPTTGRVYLRQDDVLLLCSDGLSGKLRAEELRSILEEMNKDVAAGCSRLVDEANNRGGEDNITVVLAHFSGNNLKRSTSDKIIVEAPQVEEDTTLSDDPSEDTETDQ